jgi:hypothetical protein
LAKAQAPIVAFIEDHCTPEPGWAEALIEAHKGPWAAVGYGFKNANPVNYVSRSAMITDYGLWLLPVDRGTSRVLPGNNVSYKRELLLSLGDLLPHTLVNDYVAHEVFRRRGLPLFVESQAVAAHLNFPTVWQTGLTNYAWSRVMASRRADALRWSRARRMTWGVLAPVGSPIFRIVRLLRTLKSRPRVAPAYIAALPIMTVVSLCASTGESLGYLFGTGGADELLTRWELDVERVSS